LWAQLLESLLRSSLWPPLKNAFGAEPRCINAFSKVTLCDKWPMGPMVAKRSSHFLDYDKSGWFPIPFLLQLDCLRRAFVHASTAFRAFFRAFDLRQSVDDPVHSRRTHFLTLSTPSASILINSWRHRVSSPNQRVSPSAYSFACGCPCSCSSVLLQAKWETGLLLPALIFSVVTLRVDGAP